MPLGLASQATLTAENVDLMLMGVAMVWSGSTWLDFEEPQCKRWRAVGTPGTPSTGISSTSGLCFTSMAPFLAIDYV
jgi:hypothetical protein